MTNTITVNSTVEEIIATSETAMFKAEIAPAEKVIDLALETCDTAVIKAEYPDDATVIAKLQQDIWQALTDYFTTTKYDIYEDYLLNDFTGDFVNRLARDSFKAKRNLRELFRKSPAWNESMQALVINGNRTADPDYLKIRELAEKILQSAFDKFEGDDENSSFLCLCLCKVIDFFANPPEEEEVLIDCLDAIQGFAPKAYAEGKKKSKIFRDICKSLDKNFGTAIIDETKGSQWQYLFAALADELNGRKIDFKLFVSLNPAHFLTMSNPKPARHNDPKAFCTSCHSLNDTEGGYNNGCSGYARDEVTFIAFTVADPTKPELLNNRKTTRQLFMYKVNGGVLLQSRMYTSCSGSSYGGVNYETPEGKLYRDLIEREISELEGAPNLWKLYPYNHFDEEDIPKSPLKIHEHCEFGGYPDWHYKEFKPKLAIRSDHADNPQTFTVGAAGLCIECGEEISEKIHCDYCRDCCDRPSCDQCGDYCGETFRVHSQYGGIIEVCERCLEYDYRECEDCGEFYHYSLMRTFGDDFTVCERCSERWYECDCCHGAFLYEEVQATANEDYVCGYCLENHYSYCEDCNEYYRDDEIHKVHGDDGEPRYVCDYCRDNNYSYCNECGEYHHNSNIDGGICDNCREHHDEQQEHSPEHQHCHCHCEHHHHHEGNATCEHCGRDFPADCVYTVYEAGDVSCTLDGNGGIKPLTRNICTVCLRNEFPHYGHCEHCGSGCLMANTSMCNYCKFNPANSEPRPDVIACDRCLGNRPASEIIEFYNGSSGIKHFCRFCWELIPHGFFGHCDRYDVDCLFAGLSRIGTERATRECSRCHICRNNAGDNHEMAELAALNAYDIYGNNPAYNADTHNPGVI